MELIGGGTCAARAALALAGESIHRNTMSASKRETCGEMITAALWEDFTRKWNAGGPACLSRESLSFFLFWFFVSILILFLQPGLFSPPKQG